MKKLFLLGYIFFCLQGFSQVSDKRILDLEDSLKRINTEVDYISAKLDSLNKVKALHQQEYYLLKRSELYSKELFVLRWEYKDIKKEELVNIVKVEDKWTYVNTPFYTNYKVPTYFLVKESEFKEIKNNSLEHREYSPSTKNTNNKDSQISTSSSQCLGIAKSTGVRCKNKTTNSNGYCYVHKSQAPGYIKPKPTGYTGRCCATTQKGTQCKRSASSGTRYCWQHQ